MVCEFSQAKVTWDYTSLIPLFKVLALLAQSVEHQTVNLVVVRSKLTWSVTFYPLVILLFQNLNPWLKEYISDITSSNSPDASMVEKYRLMH